MGIGVFGNDAPVNTPYISTTDSERDEMLRVVGVSSVEQLFEDIPLSHRNPDLALPQPLGEIELVAHLGRLARENQTADNMPCFLGGGSYRHYIPAAVRSVVSRGEFVTSYTPYQAEASQGTLQVLYDFQSMICQLYGMEIANAGMYDGASALAEAALMACRVVGRSKVAVTETLLPSYREVVATYCTAQGITLVTEPDEETACILIQYPNRYGYVDGSKERSIDEVAKRIHDLGGLLVMAADPVALALYRSPGEMGADIAVGEGQCLGNPPSFGGPGLGLFSCRTEYLRQLPGRIVGRTLDTQGRVGYVLTLQTREQHIRRERATSNICTNETLAAIAATAYLAILGTQGLQGIAGVCYQNAHYAAEAISSLPGYRLPIEGLFFQEFVVECPRPPAEINARLLQHGILGGVDISSDIERGLLLCFCETHTRQDIERLCEVLRE